MDRAQPLARQEETLRMRSPSAGATGSKRSLHALEWTNFFLADVQTGLGPFLAAYLAASGWNPGNVGVILTLEGIITVLLQTPAGSMIDHVRRKRFVLVAGAVVLALGALILAWKTDAALVATAQVLIGGDAPFLGPTVAAITLGIVGSKGFDCQFGRNQGFNSAGNVISALLPYFELCRPFNSHNAALA